jgi:hypothetical protein
MNLGIDLNRANKSSVTLIGLSWRARGDSPYAVGA